MNTEPKRKLQYPIGVQSFEKLRKEGYVYVDKTGYIPLLLQNDYYFLSRPRRFGKSLFLSTLEAYFKGKKELFEGLEIAKVEKEWLEYPVFHLDLNNGCYDTPQGLCNLLDTWLCELESIYGRKYDVDDLSLRLEYLIKNAHEQTGRRVVILVDEYEKPVLSSIGDENLQDRFREILKSFYANFKTCDAHIRFVMLTGVSRLGKMSVFSDLNNLIDLSMEEDYSALCGITLPEMQSYLSPGIEALSNKMRIPDEETIKKLLGAYDGYKFAVQGEMIINPFSLLYALNSRRIGDYWFSTGTPSFLVKLLQSNRTNLWNLDGVQVQLSSLTDIVSFKRDVIPLLYQSGYLTIRDYDERFDMVTLGFPNEEVRRGFTNSLLKNYLSTESQSDFNILSFCKYLDTGDVDGFLKMLQSLFAGVPYIEKKEFNYEGEFRNLMYMVLTLTGFYVDVEKHISSGRIDMVAKTDHYIYVMEFKTGGTPEEALVQIAENGYALPYASDRRKLLKVGVVFSPDFRNITAWQTE